jgi:plastocyanin
MATVLLIVAAPAALAGNHEVALKDKAFDRVALTVHVGDSVEFRNVAPFEHDVLSQSSAKTFDLEAVPPAESRRFLFDQPGTVEVECSLHSGMHLTIQVNK